MAIATLVLAIIGLVLSIASLGWQFATFMLSGPRIEAELWVGFADDEGIIRSRCPADEVGHNTHMRNQRRTICMKLQ
jgi:hypothetical protein